MPVAGPALSSSYGGTPQPGGGVLGTDGTLYVGGADSQPPAGPMGSGYALPQFGYPTPSQATAPYAPPAPAPTLPQTLSNVDMTPAMQNYVQQFQQSQDAQSQAINAGLLQATQGLMQRRDAAAQVANALPAQYEAAYRAAQGDVNSALAGERKAMGPAGKNMLGGNRDAASNAALLAGAKAAGMSELPFLQAGITAQTSQGQTALANTDMQDKAALAQQQSAFDQQMALAQQQEGFQTQQAKTAEDYAILNSTLGTNQAIKQYNDTTGKNQLTPAQQLQMYQAQLNAQPATGAAGAAGFTNGQVQQITNSPQYQSLVTLLGQSTNATPGSPTYYGPTQPGQTWSQWLSETFGPTQPDLVRYLLATLTLPTAPPIPANGSAVNLFTQGGATLGNANNKGSSSQPTTSPFVTPPGFRSMVPA